MSVLYEKDAVIDEVLKRFISRADEGMVKYGTSMAANTGDTLYWINHAIEEAMDMVNYLTRIKQELQGPPAKHLSDEEVKQLTLEV